MGLGLDHVISDSRHHGAFVCAICHCLADLDCLVTTSCSHCFCKQCLPVWLEDANKSTCPTCNGDLMYGNKDASSDRRPFMMMGSRSVLVQPLENVQPLAHRLLKSIAVRCPLGGRGVACDWEGDYGDLQSHLLSGTAHIDEAEIAGSATTAPTDANMSESDVDARNKSTSLFQAQRKKNLSLAASLKEEANAKFETKHYNESNSLYAKAISVLEPYGMNADDDARIEETEDSCSREVLLLLSALYSNRAAVHLQLRKYDACLDNCNHVLQKLDNSNIKVYVRASSACVHLGKIDRAISYIGQALEKDSSNPLLKKKARQLELLSKWNELGEDHLKRHQFADAKSIFSKLLREAPSATPFLLGAAESDLGLGLTDSALTLTKRILLKDARNARGCWVRGKVLFLMGEYQMGIRLLQEALRLDPDSEDIKSSLKIAKKVKECIETAKQKMFSRQFAEVIALLTSATQLYEPKIPPKAPLYATVHTQRAQAHLRLKQYKEVLKDCALVLYAHEDHIPTLLLRFQAYHGLEDHETAFEEAKEVLSKHPHDTQLRKAYERADFLLRKERRVDYYDLLGCSTIASEMEIKKAYKSRALEMHPDRLPPGSSEERVRDAKRKFQLLGEGLEVLCDDFKRKLYDEGYDQEGIRERVEAAEQAAHRHGGRGYPHHGHH